jgi:hypothetical protein
LQWEKSGRGEGGVVLALHMEQVWAPLLVFAARERVVLVSYGIVTPVYQPTILSYDNQSTCPLPDRVPHLLPFLSYVCLLGPLHTRPCQSPSHTHTLKVPQSISTMHESALTQSDSSLLICQHVCNVHLRIHF